MHKKFVSLFLLLVAACGLQAADIYVSPAGSDRNPGTRQAPKATLTSALRQARELRRLNDASFKEGITINLLGGTYSLYEPLFLRPEDSGTAESPTIIRSFPGEQAVLSGGVRIDGWKRQGKLLVADVPDFNGYLLDFRQLYINGQKAVRARDVQDFEKMHRIRSVDVENEILYVPAAAVKKLLQPSLVETSPCGKQSLVETSPCGKQSLGETSPGGKAEMVLHEMWCVANLRIRSIEVQGDSAAVRFHQPESRIQFEHPWPRPMVTTTGHNSAFYLTNARELLDQPGEWYYDRKVGKLYYYPLKGEVIREAIVPAIETLVNVEGTLDRPVSHIRFSDIGFQHTTWMRPSQKGHVPLQAGMYLTDAYTLTPKMVRPDGNHLLDNQGWLGRPASAVRLSAAQHIDFEDCRFEHLGSTGLDYEWGTYGGTVRNCLFRDIAGNGIVAGSFSPAAHETHFPYDPSDRREVCTHLTITNNLITDVSNEDWGTLGICAGYVSDIDINHNEISEVSYSGISLGWGWTQTVNCMRNNRVHANLIHHYAKHMYDVAGIYTLGAQPKTFITENCVHSIYHPSYVHDPNHWFYLYTDEGSSFITIRNNWTEGDKFLQNANGPGNTWVSFPQGEASTNGCFPQGEASASGDSIRARAGRRK